MTAGYKPRYRVGDVTRVAVPCSGVIRADPNTDNHLMALDCGDVCIIEDSYVVGMGKSAAALPLCNVLALRSGVRCVVSEVCLEPVGVTTTD